ncbi:ATP-binding cassette domain-containing protein [Oceanibaculum nanhaiense]|uniref:ATP-binding cassette domain-containing protein n=1 Tax=Oceanibaculum nanhaiense TaxID=1909734 RepID=UPI00396EC952
MAGVTLNRINKRFDQTEVLKEISLSIADGEFIALVGPSGCGKSTLLRIIAGLERQSAGSVSIGDRQVDALRPAHRDIAMVFQSYALYPHMTTFQNMAVPLAMRRLAYWQRWPFMGMLSPTARPGTPERQHRALR